MKKYYLRYLFFWAPAFLIACFFNNQSVASQVLQWFFAFFMVLGWSVNTGMAAWSFPRRVLSLLLVYTGFGLLAIVALYNYKGPIPGMLMLRLGGILSFTPLDIFVQALLDFPIPHEIYITLFLAGVCFIGWIVGLVCRYLHPNPYRPKLSK